MTACSVSSTDPSSHTTAAEGGCPADPSEVGGQFGSDIQPFEQVAYWRAWHNMKSLEQRGLDPLRVLVDRTPPAPPNGGRLGGRV